MEQPTNEETARTLEREIEHDREEIDRTMTQLQEKLSVEHLVDETRSYVSDWIRAASDLVVRHPLPAVGVAVLAGGLIGRSRARKGTLRALGRNGRDEVEQLVEAIVDRAVEASNASSRAAANGGQAPPATHDVMHGLSELLEETGRLLQAGGSRAEDAVLRAQDAVESLIRKQPMTLGVIGLVLGGAAVAALTRRRTGVSAAQCATPPTAAPSPMRSSRFATTIPSG